MPCAVDDDDVGRAGAGADLLPEPGEDVTGVTVLDSLRDLGDPAQGHRDAGGLLDGAGVRLVGREPGEEREADRHRDDDDAEDRHQDPRGQASCPVAACPSFERGRAARPSTQPACALGGAVPQHG